ncbi:Rhodanese-like protein [Niveomyces insectorum RCEF 264]|uniref:Rhodanese-like protein n=1 Tax=Niveomyces insectorum RCEF 264 TaxID=1081102 RepID=A0A167YXM4_9HYPO|nr:Rhodanese-like protein [Niveomyces insectorum RCEF 264]
MATVASLQRMSAAELASRLLAGPAAATATDSPKLAIVDVRDDGGCIVLFWRRASYASERASFSPSGTDYIGGHIRGSLHFPSGSLSATLPTLVRKLRDADTVVFHCALSQQRGPGAALQYLRAVEEEAARTQNGAQTAAAAAAATAAEAVKEAATGVSSASTAEASSGRRQQTVYVLDRGFVGWQEIHGEDERLTEGFRKELWRAY